MIPAMSGRTATASMPSTDAGSRSANAVDPVPDASVTQLHGRQSSTRARVRRVRQNHDHGARHRHRRVLLPRRRPRGARGWYAEHLGVGFPPESYEDDPWYQEAGPTVFAPFGRQHWESPQLGAHAWGVNFRVRDLDAIVAQLRYVGIAVEVDHESYPNGRFASLVDPEGNAVQLWEPA